MRNAADWLSQGDLFRELPIVETTLDRGDLIPTVDWGPSMLCTHDCEIDKKTNSGQSTVEKLNFVPLRSALLLDDDRQAYLRSKRQEVNPARLFFIGQVPDFGDVFCELGEVYSLPAAFFSPQLREFPEGGGMTLSLVATDNDTRIGQLDADQVSLLRKKMSAFWTRLVPVD